MVKGAIQIRAATAEKQMYTKVAGFANQVCPKAFAQRRSVSFSGGGVKY